MMTRPGMPCHRMRSSIYPRYASNLCSPQQLTLPARRSDIDMMLCVGVHMRRSLIMNQTSRSDPPGRGGGAVGKCHTVCTPSASVLAVELFGIPKGSPFIDRLFMNRCNYKVLRRCISTLCKRSRKCETAVVNVLQLSLQYQGSIVSFAELGRHAASAVANSCCKYDALTSTSLQLIYSCRCSCRQITVVFKYSVACNILNQALVSKDADMEGVEGTYVRDMQTSSFK